MEETPIWLDNTHQEPLYLSNDYIVEGKRKLTLDDETEFCSGRILQEILKSKVLELTKCYFLLVLLWASLMNFSIQLQSIFDALDGQELRRAVARSNPFETIHGGIFLNRAAMKMANMDKAFDFMFTSPKDQDGVSSISLLRFQSESCKRFSNFTVLCRMT